MVCKLESAEEEEEEVQGRGQEDTWGAL